MSSTVTAIHSSRMRILRILKNS